MRSPRKPRRIVHVPLPIEETSPPVCSPKFLELGDSAADDPQHVIDLLNFEPHRILDEKSTIRMLSFAFEGGDTGSSIRSILGNAKIARSQFDPDCFEDSLFVSELIDTCMTVQLGDFKPDINKTFLLSLLTHPPEDSRSVAFRQEILTELTTCKEILDNFKKLYRNLHSLRQLFESDYDEYEHDNRQRRLEILAGIRNAVTEMQTGFENCKSGLVRIFDFAFANSKTEEFSKLCALLDLENHLAGVTLNLRIGGDGKIHQFEVVSMNENRDNLFYRSPLSRFFSRIKMLFRGYIFSEGELVNRWIDTVYDGISKVVPVLIRLLGEMEFYLASLAFKDTAESKGLSVSFPEFVLEDEADNSQPIELKKLFNPLLFSQDIVPVPCDLESDRWETITVVTGPNSGGKTRLMQAVALAQILSECGMYAPFEKARLHRAAGLFASLIEEARADQREGRLGAELIRIRSVFEKSKPKSIVILDELCSGTNPSEGEEIFRLVVSLLSELKPRVLITTHFLQFAATLESENHPTAHLRFLKVELGEDNKPTYQFIPGVASTSLAHLTASRLGVTKDELQTLIKKNS